jgi:hypothetical protein
LELAPALNDALGASGDVVARVEAFLNEQCKIGLPCWIEAERIKSEDGPAEHHLWLGYDRVDGKFRIAVECLAKREGHDEHLGPQAWESCRRDIKLSTIPKLPKLLEALADQAAKVAEKNEVAIQAVGEILEAFRQDEAS